MSAHLLALLIGTLLDRLVGDPPALWRQVPHPVVVIGRAIGWLDARFNRAELSARRRRQNGILAVIGLVLAAVIVGLLLSMLFSWAGNLAFLLEATVFAVFLAQKSLSDHVRAVSHALDGGGLQAGRHAVSMIVGRDPDQLDEAGVARAAIESLAENASDGVVAPFLFFLVAGLPGLLVYKSINTADSMIGHLSERHRDFGWAAARLDDLLNWPAARATALIFALAAALSQRCVEAGRQAWLIARRDAPSHRSPNAGWPEAAMAAALGLSLGGPRRYGTIEVDAPTLNGEGRRGATTADIGRALALFSRLATFLLVVALAALLVSVI